MSYVPGTTYFLQLEDLDADADLDVIAADVLSNRLLYLANENGYFSELRTYATQFRPRLIGRADFDGDGDLDVAVANNDNSDASRFVELIDGSGGPLLSLALLEFPATTLSIAAADLTGDGSAELVAVSSELPGVMIASFSDVEPSITTILLEGHPIDVHAADLDGDGFSDIVVSRYPETELSLIFGGSNGMNSPLTLDVGFKPSAIESGDVDGDGLSDLLLGVFNVSEVRVLRNLGDRSFSEFKRLNVFATEPSPPNALAVCDLDRDGRQDVAAFSMWHYQAAVVTNIADERPFTRFVTTGSHDVELSAEAAACGDMNGDGNLDLVVGGTAHYYITALADDAGTFRGLTSYGAGMTAAGLALADVTGDGNLDAVVAAKGSDRVELFRGSGDGRFHELPALEVQGGPFDVGSGDFDGDGNIDLAVAPTEAGNFVFFFGRGDGSFVRRDGPPTEGTYRVTVGDLDGDGLDDAAFAVNAGVHGIQVFYGHMDRAMISGPFLDRPGSPIAAPSDVAMVDYDGDDILDLAVAPFGRSELVFFRGEGERAFAEAEGVPFAENPITIRAAARSSDGGPYLVAASWRENLVGLLHYDGTAWQQERFELPMRPRLAELVDVDGDGVDELVVLGNDESLYVYPGLARGTFGELVTLPSPGRNLDLELADINGDDALDFVMTGGAVRSMLGTLLSHCDAEQTSAAFEPSGIE